MTLTKRQRQILFAMREADGMAAFGRSHLRSFSVGLAEMNGELVGGALVYAYQQPEWHLRSRRLIEPMVRNVPGKWFRLTDQGWRAAMALRLDPQ